MAHKKMSYRKSSSKTAAGKITPRKRMAGYSKSSMKRRTKNKY